MIRHIMRIMDITLTCDNLNHWDVDALFFDTNHDFPILAKDPSFAMRELPVPREVLLSEGLSESFIGYMGNWPGFAEAE